MMPDRESDGDAGERDRVWAWGIHEDQMVSNWMVVFVLIETALVGAAVVLHFTATLTGSDGLIRVALDIVGVMVTVLFWRTIAWHQEFISRIRGRLKTLDSVYREIYSNVYNQRGRSRLGRCVGRIGDPMQILLHVIMAAFSALWIGLLVVAL